MTNLAKSAKPTIIPVLRYRDLLSTMGDCLRSRHYVNVVIAGKHPAPLPSLKIPVVNVVNLMKLQPDTEHPHGLSDPVFDEIFTEDKPIIFAFHGYPWLIHRLTNRRTNHDNIHVRGYKEEGTIRVPPRWSVRLRRCVFCGTVRTALNLMPPDICCSHDDGVPSASCKEWDYCLKETVVTNTNLPSCNAHYMLDCQDLT